MKDNFNFALNISENRLRKKKIEKEREKNIQKLLVHSFARSYQISLFVDFIQFFFSSTGADIRREESETSHTML